MCEPMGLMRARSISTHGDLAAARSASMLWQEQPCARMTPFCLASESTSITPLKRSVQSASVTQCIRPVSYTHLDVYKRQVTVLSKTWARDPATARADLDRFRRELGVDYLDVCLMHCVTEADWTERFQGVMDVLSEAKQKGIIRAHGCSCHSIEALRTAAKSPWVEIDLARINPIGSHTDADPQTVVSVLREMKAAGKAVIGMKILGQGDLRGRQSEALRYALSLGVLDAFTIGAESKAEQEDLVRRIAAA